MSSVVIYFGLGVLGGAMVDGLEFTTSVTAANGRIPARYKRVGGLIAEAVRLAVGGALAAVFYYSNQITTPLAALMVGIAAPTIIERFGTAGADFGGPAAGTRARKAPPARKAKPTDKKQA